MQNSSIRKQKKSDISPFIYNVKCRYCSCTIRQHQIGAKQNSATLKFVTKIPALTLEVTVFFQNITIYIEHGRPLAYSGLQIAEKCLALSPTSISESLRGQPHGPDPGSGAHRFHHHLSKPTGYPRRRLSRRFPVGASSIWLTAPPTPRPPVARSS